MYRCNTNIHITLNNIYITWYKMHKLHNTLKYILMCIICLVYIYILSMNIPRWNPPCCFLWETTNGPTFAAKDKENPENLTRPLNP